MHEHIWLALGVVAQLLFFARFLVQWISSERLGQSVVPPGFWYFSLAGGVLLLAYSIERRDPVFILGQGLGLLVYVRNLMLLGRRGESGAARMAPWALLAAFALLLAFTGAGTRGLWEPDEGRYAESAREMLASGDFMTPTLGGQPHWTKPPLTYWTIAGSIAAFGPSEFAVRFPTALAFVATVLLCAAFGAALWNRRAGILAGVIYATFVTTFAAANFATPDTLLALWEALALYAFWRGFTAQTRLERHLWPAVTGVAFGLAMMTKGPPGLLFLPAMFLFRALPAGRRPGAAPVLSFVGVVLFCAVGLPWYVVSVLRNPGLLDYFVGQEVVGRMMGVHHRNPEWYGAIAVYGPTLLAGAFPWCFAWPWIVRRWRAGLGGERPLEALLRRPAPLLLALAFLVPLVVFSISRSRLPLYVLPLFLPLALLTARGIVRANEAIARPLTLGLLPRRWARTLPAWAAVLIAARLVFAAWPSTQDARRVYRSLPKGRDAELVVGAAGSHYGLAFYHERDGGAHAEVEYADGQPSSRGVSVSDEIAEERLPMCPAHLFFVGDADGARLIERLSVAGAPIRQVAHVPGGVAVLTAARTGAKASPHPGT